MMTTAPNATSTGRILLAALLFAFALLMGGCDNRVTYENFQKIKIGMDLTEVEDILGRGDLQDKAGGANLGQFGLPSRAAESNVDVYVWDDGSAQIIVEFIDYKVVASYQRGL